ncbi:MAG: energy transducer TonB [Bacteroidales bacterium]
MYLTLHKSILLLIAIIVSTITAPVIAQMQLVRQYAQNSNTPTNGVYNYDYVDEQPHFPGGEHGLTKYINQTREYPYQAHANRIEGRVLCSFLINEDGSVSDIRIVRGVETSLNDEAVRIINNMPKWEPGREKGQEVKVRYVIPIVFRL